MCSDVPRQTQVWWTWKEEAMPCKEKVPRLQSLNCETSGLKPQLVNNSSSASTKFLGSLVAVIWRAKQAPHSSTIEMEIPPARGNVCPGKGKCHVLDRRRRSLWS